MEDKEKTIRPFYDMGGRGLGAFCDGICGLGIGSATIQGKNVTIMRISPLKRRYEVGTEKLVDKDVITDDIRMELAFTSEKSVDAVIETLQKLKSKFYGGGTEANN